MLAMKFLLRLLDPRGDPGNSTELVISVGSKDIWSNTVRLRNPMNLRFLVMDVETCRRWVTDCGTIWFHWAGHDGWKEHSYYNCQLNKHHIGDKEGSIVKNSRAKQFSEQQQMKNHLKDGRCETVDRRMESTTLQKRIGSEVVCSLGVLSLTEQSAGPVMNRTIRYR